MSAISAIAPKHTLSSALARAVVLSVACGMAVGAIFFVTGGDGSLLGWLVATLESVTYSVCIALPATFVFFKVGSRFRGYKPSLQALAYFASLLPLAVAGCLLADLLIVASGRRELADLGVQLATDLKVVLTISLVAGMAIVGYERVRSRLDDAHARLREEELARERALRLASDAQLSSVESRLRPHFLFNALNAVLALIPEDPKRAEEVLERFTGLLRASLRADAKSVVPLAEEAAFVRDYLEVERARFGDRLRFSIDVPPELEATFVPAFSVQTLAENCVKHVAAKRREGALVSVSARLDGERAVVTVEYDGPGFDGGAIPAGHGIDTLRGRLGAIFGGAAALEIEARARVVMRVPLKAREAP